jgi:hypothetical protein
VPRLPLDVDDLSNLYERGKRKLIRDVHEAYDRIQRSVLDNRGVDVTERDWDNLIILDACRADLFEECCEIEGDMSTVLSRGSHTSVFLQENFTKSYYGDTVYISATPQFEYRGMSGRFFKDVQIWKTGWDDDVRTVRPETMVEVAKREAAEHPDKRLIVHFLQPHYPFIGPTGRKITHRTVRGGGRIEDDREDVWTLLSQGEIDEQVVWQAYRENLELTLPHVEELIDAVEGKSVITSDHGNSFGEWFVYGHPARTYLKNLVYVPWLEVSCGGRRSITTEPPYRELGQQSDANSVEQKLADLGYK